MLSSGILCSTKYEISHVEASFGANTTNTIYVDFASCTLLKYHPCTTRLEAILALSVLLSVWLSRIGHGMTMIPWCGWHTVKTLLLSTIGTVWMKEHFNRKFLYALTLKSL
jgi:hypothetical protein